MARKQKLNEEQIDETEAADSLKPGSHAVSDPASMTSKSAILARMIGAAHAMEPADLTKWYDQMMEFQKQAGHGMGVGDVAGRNKASVNMHPSGASHVPSNVKEAMQQDVVNMLDGEEGLSEEFKGKAATLFEAAVEARVNAAVVELEEQAAEIVEQQVQEMTGGLVETLEQYLDYVAGEWLKENEVAIESSLRNEMTAEFINGLRTLFLEHNVNIPEDKVDIVDTMATKIEELETRVNDLINEKSELEEFVCAAQKKEAVDKICEGLTLAEAEKLRELSENVEADDLETYSKKVQVIKESNFVKGAKKTQKLNESLEEINEAEEKETKEEKTYTTPQMKSYASAISRTVRQL